MKYILIGIFFIIQCNYSLAFCATDNCKLRLINKGVFPIIKNTILNIDYDSAVEPVCTEQIGLKYLEFHKSTKKNNLHFYGDTIIAEPKVLIVPIRMTPLIRNMPIVSPPKYGKKITLGILSFQGSFLPAVISTTTSGESINPIPEIKLEREQSDETKVAVYFTDGKDKFYKTELKCALFDPENNKIVQRFTRTVLSNGEPEPATIKAFGKFKLQVFNKEGDIVMELPNVEIEKGKLNKVVVKYQLGTIMFQYHSALHRPVQYNASIRSRFQSSNVFETKLKCTEKIQLDAGDYYVEIDLLPKYKIVTEVNSGKVTIVAISQPGKVIFTNTQPLGEVILYTQLGNQFVEFHSLTIQGAKPSQLLLQPGLYKASIKPVGAAKKSPPVIVNFVVRDNKSTMVELRDIGDDVIQPDLSGTSVYDNANDSSELNTNSNAKPKTK
jgi:hypothetical protein